MIQHYVGVIGTFDYDDTEFKLQPRNQGIFEDEWNKCLSYIGKETNGENIHIPDGITSCVEMFCGNKNITSTPKIPNSVENASYMFMSCTNLKKVNPLPDSIKYTRLMFFNCTQLEEFKVEFPKNLTNSSEMFCGCSNLKYVTQKYFPLSLSRCSLMFEDCVSLIQAPRFLKSAKLESCYSMFANCIKLQNVYESQFLLNLSKTLIRDNYFKFYQRCRNIKLPAKSKNKAQARFIKFCMLSAYVESKLMNSRIYTLSDLHDMNLNSYFNKNFLEK